MSTVDLSDDHVSVVPAPTFVVEGDGTGGPVDWDDVYDKPSTFPPAVHRHGVADIDNLGPELEDLRERIDAAGGGDGPVDPPTWSEVTGKPTAFPPSVHTHAVGDVEGLEGRLSTLESAPPGDGEAATWANLQGKPATFPPNVHDHETADVNGLDAALEALDDRVEDLESVPAAEQATWSTLQGKPSTYPPSAHGHAVGDVSGLQAALDGKQAAGSYQPAGSYATPADVTTASTADRARANHTGTQPVSTVTGAVAGLNGVTGVWKGTQAQYDAITTKDDNVLYAVVAG